MNEDRFTAALAGIFSSCRSDVFTGIGDDAAVLDLSLPDEKLLLAAADQVIRDIHFTPETPPELIAKKLLNRNVSDIAAMGGVPTHALLTVAIDSLQEDQLKAFHKGLAEEAAKYGIAVIGGDLAHTPKDFVATLTILGTVAKKKLCLRTNAKVGDILYLTGSFGRSFQTGHHLTFAPRLDAAQALAGTYTNAMMDVSDGLAKDLARFASASGVSCRITAELPKRDGATDEEALNDGEDYELILAVPPEKCPALEQSGLPEKLGLTRAGIFTGDQPAGTVFYHEQKIQEKGYDHFHEN